jgi:hypothetical protein
MNVYGGLYANQSTFNTSTQLTFDYTSYSKFLAIGYGNTNNASGAVYLLGVPVRPEKIIYVGDNATSTEDGSESLPYNSIEDAISAVSVDDSRIIFNGNATYTESAAITFPSYDVVIDGREYTLSRSSGGNIFLFTGAFTGTVIIKNITLNKASLYLYPDASAKIIIDNVKMDRFVRLEGSSAYEVVIRNCEIITTTTANYALRIDNANAVVKIENSKLVGYSGKSAIGFDGVTNNHIEIVNSTLLHGDGAGNNPFGNITALPGPLTYSAVQSVFNVSPERSLDYRNSVLDIQNRNTYLNGFSENVDVDSAAAETVDEFPDTLGSSVKWEILITKSTNVQRVTAVTVWSSGVAATLVTDTIVSRGTIDVTLSCDISSSNVRLRATTTSDDWVVSVISRILH